MDIHRIKTGVGYSYLVKDRGTLLIDAGMPGSFNKIIAGLKKNNIDPRGIDIILITHGHWDHIGAARQLKELTNAKIIIHEKDTPPMLSGEITIPQGVTPWGSIFRLFLQGWVKCFSIQPCEPDTLIRNDAFPLKDFGVDGTIVHTPGHSPGSVSLILDSGDAFVGDMAMNGLPLTFGPALPIMADNKDIDGVRNSWKKILEAGATTIYPAHGNPFSIDKLMGQIL